MWHLFSFSNCFFPFFHCLHLFINTHLKNNKQCVKQTFRSMNTPVLLRHTTLIIAKGQFTGWISQTCQKISPGDISPQTQKKENWNTVLQENKAFFFFVTRFSFKLSTILITVMRKKAGKKNLFKCKVLIYHGNILCTDCTVIYLII